MRFIYTFFLPFSLVLGCSSATKDQAPSTSELLPPNIYLDHKSSEEAKEFIQSTISQSQNRNTLWWGKYNLAQISAAKNPGAACNLFKELANASFFPLQELALFRAYSYCPLTADGRVAELKALPREANQPWLKLAHEEALEKVSIASQDYGTLLKIHLNRSKRSLVPTIKVKETLSAVKFAKKANQTTELKYLNDRLKRLSPRLTKKPSPRQYYAIATDHRNHREFDKAIYFYKKFLRQKRLSDPQRYKALLGLRKTYKIQKNDKQYIRTTEDLARHSRKRFFRAKRNDQRAKDYAKYHVLLARTYWTKSMVTKAEKTLRGLAGQLKTHKKHLPKIYWLLGRIYEERGQFKTALDWFKKGTVFLNDDHPMNQQLLWSVAWNHRKLTDFKQSTLAFEKLISRLDKDRDSSLVARSRFWLAKTYADAGDKATSSAIFNELMTEDSLGYYGLISHREANKEIELQSPVFERQEKIDLDRIQKVSKWYSHSYLQWLNSVNESEISLEYLKTLKNDFSQRNDLTTMDYLALLQLYSESKHNLQMLRLLGQLSPKIKEQIYSQHPSLLFPRPYLQNVKSAAKAYGVQEELIYAIMRQESYFNPKARSHVDAFGLMQILPSVAQNMAKQEGLSISDPLDLYEPELNIQLGSALLKKLSQRHNGQFLRMVASYNAPEKAMLGWIKTRYKGDTVTFVEDIPYKETQNYFKLVLRNLVYYQLITSPERKIAFPDWCLNLTHSI